VAKGETIVRSADRACAAAVHRLLVGVAAVLSMAGSVALPSAAWAAPQPVPISGAGSTWAYNAMDQWRRAVQQSNDLYVNFAPTGSSDGRNQFTNGTVDFAISEVPYGFADAFVASDQPPANRPFAYLPIVAGGTAFVYNLRIDGRRVTNLRLSGDTIARIFTKNITRWDDPRIRADNPRLVLPARDITAVVRTDGNGTTLQLTRWMSKQHPALWNAFCQARGGTPPCGPTVVFPTSGFIAQTGSTGVGGYISQSSVDGAIGYLEYSYALNSRLPAVKMLNSAGYYTAPTADAVAVALTAAEVIDNPSDPRTHLTQNLDRVYTNPDKRAYPLSSYSYLIVPKTVQGSFNVNNGYTLAEFGYYALCEGQRAAPPLGYAPLPINLVRAGLDQLATIPGAVARTDPIAGCNNPTFSPDGTNTLLLNAPQPLECDNRDRGLQCGSPTIDSLTLTGDVAPGAFSLAVASPTTALANGTTGGSATGILPEVTVIDLRGSNAGWDVTAQVTEFIHDTQPTATIPGSQLGWTPSAHKNSGSGAVLAGNPVAAGTTPGGLADGVTLCSAVATSSAGTFACNAELVLNIPDTALPGSYSATLTLTLA
jgi:phosphate ABC transporter phosphate-binding protein